MLLAKVHAAECTVPIGSTHILSCHAHTWPCPAGKPQNMTCTRSNITRTLLKVRVLISAARKISGHTESNVRSPPPRPHPPVRGSTWGKGGGRGEHTQTVARAYESSSPIQHLVRAFWVQLACWHARCVTHPDHPPPPPARSALLCSQAPPALATRQRQVLGCR